LVVASLTRLRTSVATVAPVTEAWPSSGMFYRCCWLRQFWVLEAAARFSISVLSGRSHLLVSSIRVGRTLRSLL
jgi:hypothetical protein